jgi:hypothetical protein
MNTRSRPHMILILLLLQMVLGIVGCSIASIGAHRGAAFAPVADIPSGTALVYFYKALGYGRGEFPVVIGGKLITTLKKGGYYPYFTEAGTIKITLLEKVSGRWVGEKDHVGGIKEVVVTPIHGEFQHSISLEVEAGKTYYVRESAGGSVGLQIVDEKTALAELSKCKLLPNP